MQKSIRMVWGLFLMLASLFSLTAGIENNRFKPVTITIGDNEIRWKTTMNTVSACLYELGILVAPKDEVIPSLKAPIVNGMHITVKRMFGIQLVDGNSKKTYSVSARSVALALEELGIKINPEDVIQPGLDKAIGPGSKIKIVRRETKIQQEIVKIPYTTWEFRDNRIDEGKTKIWRQGESGSKEVSYLICIENGETVKKTVLEETLLTQPKMHVVARGTKPLFYTLKTPLGPITYTKKMRIEATAYYPGPESTGVFADGFTSIGLKAGHGIIAVDPKVIPLCTRVYIPNYGFAIAGDVGGAIKGHLIDLCFETYREAIQFGRRYVDLYILSDQGR